MEKNFVDRLPRVFCDVDVINALIARMQEKEDTAIESPQSYEDKACTLEITDVPVTVVWTPASNEAKELATAAGFRIEWGSGGIMFAYLRSEWGTDSEDIDAAVTADENDQIRGKSHDAFISNQIGPLYNAVNGLNRFLQDENLYECYMGLDPEKEGLLITLENGEIVTRVVSGCERPDLVCNTLFGMKTRRPYADEENVYEDEDEDEDEGEDMEQEGDEFQVEDGEIVRYVGDGTDITIPDGIKAIGNGSRVVFMNSNVETVHIPDSVEAIKAYAFYGCDTLKKIHIPESVCHIGDHAFRQCTNLQAVEIPDTISKIERECFWACMKLESVKLPKNLVVIEEKAFSGCLSLKEIVIPEGTVVLEDGVFWGDGCLQKAVIPASVQEIGEMAFADCNRLTIYAPVGSVAQEYAEENEINFVAI